MKIINFIHSSSLEAAECYLSLEIKCKWLVFFLTICPFWQQMKRKCFENDTEFPHENAFVIRFFYEMESKEVERGLNVLSITFDSQVNSKLKFLRIPSKKQFKNLFCLMKKRNFVIKIRFYFMLKKLFKGWF